MVNIEDFNLKSYLHEVDSIKKLLNTEQSNSSSSSTDLHKNLNELDNYLDQIKCVNLASLFNVKNDDDEDDKNFNTSNLNNEASNLTKLNKLETKQKLLLKLTRLVNESIQLIQMALLV